MLQHFLEANRDGLIERCRSKSAARAPPPTSSELEHGIPVFLSQLVETLRIERGSSATATQVGPEFPASAREGVPARIAASATKHGHEMLHHGFTAEQVVHGYGDLCQAITELAVESGAHISAEEFNVLNRCLDDAIADAVTEFQRQRERRTSADERRAEGERLGSLVHELRDLLGTATLAFGALKGGSVGTAGATSAVLERSLSGMRDMIDRTVVQVRLDAGMPTRLEPILLDRFIADVQAAARLNADARNCDLAVFPVEPGLLIHADRQLLHSAVSNLLHNAFKFTRKHGRVTLRAHGAGGRVLIEVRDECGGLPEGKAEALFASFAQHGPDRTGLGLGLSIARRAVEAMAGSLRVRDLPGTGCVFTIDLPAQQAPAETIGKTVACGVEPSHAANDESCTAVSDGALAVARDCGQWQL